MPLSVDQFVKHLTESGLIPAADVLALLRSSKPQDGQEFARELVRQQKLTRFQADAVYQGNTTGLVLGNYVLLDKIGQGGMGQVFKAQHRRMERIVALKVLPSTLAKDEHAAKRFQREVKAAARLSHPNIVTAHDADEANGVHFLVMEYVEASNLSSLVKNTGPLPVGMAVHCILQAAKGLAYAHNKGVVHRDVKPANLLMDSEGTVKILDMGLARIDNSSGATPGAEATGLTDTGQIMGTVDYMPPEQALNAKQADHRADVYSLGCSLYYLLGGKPIYGGTMIEKLLAHREQPIPLLRELQKDVPDDLDAVFRKMVAKTPEDRYQSMTEVIAELQFGVEALENTHSLPSALKGVLSASATQKVSSMGVEQATPALDERAAAHQGGATQVMAVPSSKPMDTRPRKKLLISSLAAGVLAALLAGALVLKLKPSAGTVVVETTEKVTPVPPEEKPIVVGGRNPTDTLKDPAFNHWLRNVADLPAEMQVEAVAAKLKELNPDFDGQVRERTIVKGVVTEFRFETDNVTDVSPVRALKGLIRLDCRGSKANAGQLSDLSPLAGLNLRVLHCYFNPRLASLKPLEGMALEGISCGNTQVADLTPLKGMPILSLAAPDTKVSDLTSLAGKRLIGLNLANTKVTDLSPLKGAPLELLFLEDVRVQDWSILKSMPIRVLDVRGTGIDDLSGLKGMPLKELYCDFKPFRDTDVLRSIKTLERINDKSVKAFWKEVDAK